MKIRQVFAVAALAALSGCYSFTGASIPSHIHTIGIPLTEDQSSFGQSNLRQHLTDLLVAKFTREGSLQVAPRNNADALLETIITTVTSDIVGVRAGESPTSRRVTISVEATYRDLKKQKTFWQRQFQESSDYAIADNITGEKNAIDAAEDKLGEDLLLAVISNW